MLSYSYVWYYNILQCVSQIIHDTFLQLSSLVLHLLQVDLKPRCWVILYTPRDQDCAQQFCNMMRMVCRNLGIQVGEPVLAQLRDDRTDSYIGALKQQYHNQVMKENTMFVFCSFTSLSRMPELESGKKVQKANYTWASISWSLDIL